MKRILKLITVLVFMFVGFFGVLASEFEFKENLKNTNLVCQIKIKSSSFAVEKIFQYMYNRLLFHETKHLIKKDDFFKDVYKVKKNDIEKFKDKTTLYGLNSLKLANKIFQKLKNSCKQYLEFKKTCDLNSNYVDVFKLSLEDELEQKEKEKSKSLFKKNLFYPKKETEDETSNNPINFDGLTERKSKSLFAESLFYPKKEAEDETNDNSTNFDGLTKRELKSLFKKSLHYIKQEAEDETNNRPTIFDRISLEEFCKQVEDVDFKYLFLK